MCGSKQYESANSTPSCDQRSSGQTAAAPAYAASTCSQHAVLRGRSRRSPAAGRSRSSTSCRWSRPPAPGRRPAATVGARCARAQRLGRIARVVRPPRSVRTPCVAQPGDPGRLLDRGVRPGSRCRRCTGGRTPSRRASGRRWPGAAPPRVATSVRRGRRVLDDAAARRRRAEPLRQAEQVDQPVQHHGLDLGAGRAGGPEHALHAEPGADQVAEHRRAGGVGREVGEEAGVLPVRQARQRRSGRGR